ncbi:MAG: hypothetical protein ABIX01_15205 [Chitinophagaceae bacterium]
MSEGNDIFYYGDKAAPVQYDKKEIVEIRAIRPQVFGSPISQFIATTIKFSDGTVIIIPNIFTGRFALGNKLSGYNYVEEGGFPFIRTG